MRAVMLMHGPVAWRELDLLRLTANAQPAKFY